MGRIALAILCFLITTQSLVAEGRTRLGYGRLITNDTFGDSYDRWRTGSLAASRIWGSDWTGRPPSAFGDFLELRWGLEVLSPESIIAPAPLDRPYAGALSVGLHTHFAAGAADVSTGLDLVFTGPQTQLDELQNLIHDVFSVRPPSDTVLNAQIGNGVHPTFVFEAGRDIAMREDGLIRPFVEARAGIETYVRAGFDLTFGELLQNEFLVRDPVTGQRYRVIRENETGLAFVAGADIAYVADSVFLPESRGLELSDHRIRARAGLHWQNRKGYGAFYGLTWLNREFKTQREGQLIGSVRIYVEF